MAGSQYSGRNRSSSNAGHMRWIERSLMIAIGFIACFGVLYTNKLMNNSANLDQHLHQDHYRRSSFAHDSSPPTNPNRNTRTTTSTSASTSNTRRQIYNDFRSLQTKLKTKTDSDTNNGQILQNLNTQTTTVSNNKHQTEPKTKTEKKKKKKEKKKKKKEEEKKQEQANRNGMGDDDRLNIVLFYADDWTMKALGKLNPNVHTPNIDAMVDRGMLFTNNCVTTSVCWISRATLMTGTYYSRHLQGAPSQESLFRTHNWNDTLFPLLKNAGYYTGMFGKWHAPQNKPEMNAAFDKYTLYSGFHWSAHFSAWRSTEKKHVTEINRMHAVEFLKNRPKDQKFALKVSFFATHALDNQTPNYQPMNWSRLGYYPDEKSHENYTTFVPPKTATEKHWKELPYFFGDKNCGRLRWRNRWEPNAWQKNTRDLYAMVTEVDWAIGEILEVLKQQGVQNKTLLVFTTDNGEMHGAHGLAGKWYPFEESIKVPLVIQDPRMPPHRHGEFNTEHTLNVDLAPTLLGAAGLAPSNFMQGRDIADLYLADNGEHGEHQTSEPKDERASHKNNNSNTSGEEQQKKWKNNIGRYTSSKNATLPWRKEWFYEWNKGNPINASGHSEEANIPAVFALITPEWKFISWPQKSYEQLYHRSLDPYDEYDILQNYYLHHETLNNNKWVEVTERLRMENFTPSMTTPLGDSIQSTVKIYETLKARFYELKEQVQSGNKI